MSSQQLSISAGTRPRRSYTALPQYDGSKDVAETPKEHKKHRSRHSLHHHLPQPYRRLKEAQPSSSTTLLGTKPFKVLSEKLDNASSAVGDSRPQSMVAPVNPTSETTAAMDLVKPEDLERERQLSQARNNELRDTLHSLSELSMSTTRELDNIYYALLEKLSTLRSTLSNLQELSTLMRQLRHSFNDQADSLKEEMQEQINNFGGFNMQKERIDGLEGRITRSRDEANGLSESLRVAQERIQALEVQEGQWQASVSRRLTMFWTVLGIVLALLIAISAFNHSGSTTTHHEIVNATGANISLPAPLDAVTRIVAAALHDGEEASSTSSPPSLSATSTLEEDPRLRVFDEL